MTKSKKRKMEVEKDVLFCCQIEKDIFKKLIKKQSEYLNFFGKSVLNGILFELKDDVLTMASTDGNRLLETKVIVCNSFKNGQGIFDGKYLGMIHFIKNICFDGAFIDMLQINFYDDCMQIKDLANSIEYNVPKLEGHFPNYKSLFPVINKENSKEYTTIGVNMNFLKELNKLSVNERTGIVELTFKNGECLTPIVAECDNIEIKSRALIMPIKIKK